MDIQISLLDDKTIVEGLLGLDFHSSTLPDVRKKVLALIDENADEPKFQSVFRAIYHRFFADNSYLSALGKRSLADLGIPGPDPPPYAGLPPEQRFNLKPQTYLDATYTRTVTVDSALRSNKSQSVSTDFVFSLSETVKNVTKIRLSSVSIPYTWNVISSNHGSNVLVFKNNIKGMDDGDFDILISIAPGNYTADDLVRSINDEIDNTQLQNADLDLTGTRLFYNPQTSRVSMSVNFQRVFRENDFIFTFTRELADFLGFSETTYTTSVLLSQATISTADAALFSLSDDNNYFEVELYIEETAVRTKRVTLATGESLSRNAIESHLWNAILDTSLFDSDRSSLALMTPVESTPTSFFELRLIMNTRATYTDDVTGERKTWIPVIPGLKARVIFPDETGAVDNNTRIWTGASSCFRFPSSVWELSQLFSETIPSTTEFEVSDNAKIVFECITPNFVGEDHNISLTIPNAATKYLLEEYMNAITASLATRPDIFNMEHSKAFRDSETHRFSLKLQMKKTIDGSNIVLSVPEASIFQKLMGADNAPTIVQTGSEWIISGNSADSVTGYQLNGDVPMFITNEAVYNTNPELVVNTTGEMKWCSNFEVLVAEIQTQLVNWTDSVGDKLFSNSSLTFSAKQNDVIPWRLTVVFKKHLTHKDYSIEFINSSWNTNLLIIPSTTTNLRELVVLGQSYVTFVAPSSIVGGDLFSPSDSAEVVFSIRPNTGVIPSLIEENHVLLRLPGVEYTRGALLKNLNDQLAGSIGSGTHFSIETTADGSERVSIFYNVNHIVTHSDYSLLLYDTSHTFLNCAAQQMGLQTTYDNTLGWILGFHAYTEYNLGLSSELVADSCINTNVYSYFYIVLDDYCLNRIDDHALTIAPAGQHFATPTYAVRYSQMCRGGSNFIDGVPDPMDRNQNKLTQNQVIAANQIANSALDPFTVASNKYAVGVSIPNILAHIPLNLAGLSYGQTFTDSSPFLQSQTRNYVVPSQLARMAVQLRDRKGNVVDLSGADWSFTFIIEYLVGAFHQS